VRRGLIAVQVGLALTLASAGALIGLSLLRLTTLDPGFAARGVSAARVTAVASAHAERADVERFVSTTVAALDALPGVARAAAGSSLPLSGQATGTGVMVEGQPLPPSARPGASWEFVTPAYFDVLGIAVRSGRTFQPGDRERTSHVTIINESLARRLFPLGNAVGRRLFIGGDDDPHEIVGVVADVRHFALAEPADPRVYDLLGQHWGRTVYLVTRADAGQPPVLATTIRRVVAGIDPEAPVFEAATLDDLVGRSAAPQVLTAAVAAGLAFAALALALAGVAATAASAVAQRRREMGVRAALGAAPADVFWLILRESATTVSAGAAVGIAGAAGAAHLLTARVFGLAGADALFVVPLVALALAAAGVASSLPSARGAARSNPVDAMRAE
jgi:putative ABC transport system permease protein